MKLGKLMTRFALLLILFAIPQAAKAQAVDATATSKMGWNQAGPDLATISAYTYKYYADGATTGVTFPTTVICSGTTAPFTCVVNIPIFTQGNHSVILTASSIGGESPKSAPLAFKFNGVPPTPTGFHIIP